MGATMTSARVRLFLVAAVMCALVVLPSAVAQEFPQKPIRLIVPFAPGGNADIIARILIPKMVKVLGQPIIIDNRGGAGGTIGSEVAARAAPDGYTLLLVSASHVINPAVVRKLPYDSIKDFTPISMIADVPTAFVIHPSLPVHSVREFVDDAKSRPGKLNYSTAGRGTVGHLAAEMLAGSLSPHDFNRPGCWPRAPACRSVRDPARARPRMHPVTLRSVRRPSPRVRCGTPPSA